MIEKLTEQLDNFQKEFNLFLKSRNVPERAAAFKDLIKTIFKFEEVHLVYKKSFDSEWEPITNDRKFTSRDLTAAGITINSAAEFYDGLTYKDSIILALSDSSFMGILLGEKLSGGVFSDSERITLQLLIRVFESESNSYLSQRKEKELIFSLNEKILQLNSLIDTGMELSRFDRRDVLFELALERACALMNASSALLTVMDNTSHIIAQITFPPGSDTTGIVTNRFKIESLFTFNNCKYVITLSEKETRLGATAFSDLDQILLDAISKQVYVVIENEFLQQQIVLKQRYEQELSVAASIQQQIIPDKLPDIEGYEIAGINIPSREVGGDYYDCIKLGKGKFALIMADVSGKGIAAALLVNTLNAALYSYLEFDFPLTEMTDKLNKLIYKCSPVDKFITYFIAVLDTNNGSLDVVNAGHNPVLLLRSDGTLDMINAGGVGLGMFDLGIPYSGQKFTLNSGDKLFLYTDGIPEAMNITQDEYSDERMIEFLKTHSGLSAGQFIKMIVDDVKSHTGTAEQSDDITALYIIRK